MEKIIIFGVSQLASLAHFYFEHDSPHEVVAFTLDKEYITENEFRGLPVIAFDEIEGLYPPSQYKMFLPISFKQMNFLRKRKYEQAKQKGYQCVSYISSKATTWPDLDVGENCFIFEDNTIQPFVKIGNNCVLWSGNHIGHHTEIRDHVFITSQVVISGCCIIEENAFFGVNATIRDETTIGKGTLVGMGANITKDTPEYSIWIGAKSAMREDKSIDIDSISHKTKG
ncbi:acetyltransferase [Flavobacterium pallidum]|uniref:Sugar O-acyltransferase n=1 Tax=Flavobacterium pallidum TaxID=2172098 RepID=A0A2S1SGX2_9FLAO|nr:acetyltransferase [Flavobacterium pallidum]AWI25653.1 sugar O-acyltransferase [Flavobacterium pallidum]